MGQICEILSHGVRYGMYVEYCTQSNCTLTIDMIMLHVTQFILDTDTT